MKNLTKLNIANTTLSLLAIAGLFIMTGESDELGWQLVTSLGGLTLMVVSLWAIAKING